MIITVTLNPAVDKVYWVEQLNLCNVAEDQFLRRAIRSATSAGGKGVNMSVFLSAMGMENVAMGFVGGHTGHIIVRDLRDRGVTTNFIWTREETRTNVTVLEKGHESAPLLIGESGGKVTPVEIDRFMRRYRRMLPDAKWVVLGGSLPPGVDPGIYHELADMARKAGARVVVSAGGEVLVRSFEASPYLVKPDTRDHRELMGIDLAAREEIVEAGKQVTSFGAEMVVISHQVTGDICITRDAVWEIKTTTSTAELRNLVGADDVFLAGIMFGLVKGDPLEEALRFGLAAGLASAVSDDKVCGKMDVIRAEMEKVSVERI
jgi:1-phosphofructokinase family hexose kinase